MSQEVKEKPILYRQLSVVGKGFFLECFPFFPVKRVFFCGSEYDTLLIIINP
jgi:hypothetical protein